MVPRVYHIYGVNCDTEVGAAYKYRPFRVKERMINTGIEVDQKARISSARKNGYKISGGIIEETKDTEQVELSRPSASAHPLRTHTVIYTVQQVKMVVVVVVAAVSGIGFGRV